MFTLINFSNNKDFAIFGYHQCSINESSIAKICISVASAFMAQPVQYVVIGAALTVTLIREQMQQRLWDSVPQIITMFLFSLWMTRQSTYVILLCKMI